MKFDRLRMVGFKSFVDPTEFIVADGLTGVVGPNGCGKSNLVDALRWVMGDNSYKSMRGSGMEDVIFSGSVSRPARNFGDVTVFLDNSARTAPAAFNDADILEVTRRIEREAGSVYKVNGRDVRAKDVQLLFADASTGAHSTALVRQGQIGELISAKPVARRAILEDAAGISGLHARRHEAELRLRAADDNLTRLEDILAQQALQLDSLKRQARQARRYRNISGDIRKAEAQLYTVRWRQGIQTIKEIDKASTANAAALAEHTRAHSECMRLQSAAADALPPLRETQARTAAALQRQTFALNQLQQEEARQKARQQELREILDTATRDREREVQTIADYSQTLSHLETQEREIKATLAQSDDRQAASEQALQKAEARLAREENHLAHLTREAAASEARRNELNRTIAHENQQLEKIGTELEQVIADSNNLAHTDALAQELDDYKGALNAAETALEHAEQRMAEAERAHQQATNAEAKARAPLAQTERTLNQLETEAKTLRQLLTPAQSASAAPVIDDIQVDAGLETALGMALGDTLEAPYLPHANVDSDDLPMAWRQPGPDAGDPFLPSGTSSLLQYVRAPAFLHRRLAQIGLVEAHQGAHLQSQLRPGQRLVSREGDVWRWDGFYLRSGAATAATMRLAQRNRLEELDSEIAATHNTLVAHQNAHQDAVKGCTGAEEKVKQARTAWRLAQTEREKARASVTESERTYADLRVRRSALEEARLRLQERHNEALRTKDTALADLDALTREPDQTAALEAYKDQVQQVQKARHAYGEARASTDALASEIKAQRQRLGTIDHERKQWQRRIETAEKHALELSQRTEQTTRELEQCANIPALIEDKRKRLLSEQEQAEHRHKQAQDAVVSAEQELAARESATGKTAAALATCREDHARLQERLEAAQAHQALVTQQMRETLECSPEETLTISGLHVNGDNAWPEPEKLEKRLARLKAERERLGGVNLRAEDEAEEVRARHEALQQEQEDLIAAIAKLRHGIASLNREGRERLLNAFGQVDQHFRSLFRKLFHGGEARLALIESDDPLQAGLEILARPPGKKPQALTLLSGGEQALTTLALIFAVFLTNPAPICVLDEVDAPLDDANVERFCQLMDDMAEKTDTRFIIITHNPITMARMHRLFGVTMAERGVSQLVSVDLETAESYREAG